MRYLSGFVCVLTLAVLPLSASAQAGEADTTLEPNLGESVSSPAAGTEVPDIDTLSQRATEHYEIQSAQPRSKPHIQRARGGLIVSAVTLAGGAAAMGGAAAVARNADDLSDLGPAAGLGIFGAALMVGGIIGIGISGKRLSTANRKQHEVEQAHYGTPRRVQWDLARSRLVF